jgi:hypothetical protein
MHLQERVAVVAGVERDARGLLQQFGGLQYASRPVVSVVASELAERASACADSISLRMPSTASRPLRTTRMPLSMPSRSAETSRDSLLKPWAAKKARALSSAELTFLPVARRLLDMSICDWMSVIE